MRPSWTVMCQDMAARREGVRGRLEGVDAGKPGWESVLGVALTFVGAAGGVTKFLIQDVEKKQAELAAEVKEVKGLVGELKVE